MNRRTFVIVASSAVLALGREAASGADDKPAGWNAGERSVFDWEPPKWVPPLWQTITTAIAVAAFVRAGKPTLPLVWVEALQDRRGPGGATMTLKVHNVTDRSVWLNDVWVNGSKISRAINAPAVWVDRQSIGVNVPPDGKFEFAYSIPLAESNSPTKERIKLSVSTMRWIARKRTMTIPVIIPKYVDKSQIKPSS